MKNADLVLHLLPADPVAFIDRVSGELEHDFAIGHFTLQLKFTICERAGISLVT